MNLKFRNILTFLLWIAIVSIGSHGCSPEEGPASLQGPPGVQGVQGPQGPQGEQGEPGTANVMSSEWINFDASNWNQVTEFGRVSQLYDIDDGNITEEIIDTGVVLVYIKLGGAPAPRALPMTGYVTSSSLEQHIWYRLQTGKITLVFHNLNNTNNPGTFGSSNSYRYIVIPSGTIISRNLSVSELKKLSFNDVQKSLNLLSE